MSIKKSGQVVSIMLAVFIFLSLTAYSQGNVEVEGSLKVGMVDSVETGSDVVRLSDGTLAVRKNVESVSIGDTIEGGIVFWLDDRGYHGLTCTLVDVAELRWNPEGISGVTQATGNGIYAGIMNTPIIIASQTSIGIDGSPYAALLCANYSYSDGDSPSDWYLPSVTELSIMIGSLTQIGIGQFKADSNYWSSTEVSQLSARVANGSTGLQSTAFKSVPAQVRCVRKFSR